jgi:ABC-type amino acid transport substrate-binding protein
VRALSLISLLVAAVALALVLIWHGHTQNLLEGTAPHQEGALERIKRERVVRAGYGIFPPYTEYDPNEADPAKRVKGIAVDMMNTIAARHTPPWRVEWYRFNWETVRADMDSKRFDVIADGLYETMNWGADFGLSEPFSYFGVGCAIVRKDDERFKTFDDLDRPDITIAVSPGWLARDLAHRRLTKPKLKDVIIADSSSVLFDEVLFGRADVALNDVPTVLPYAKAHSGAVKALWIDHPPSVVAGGFAVRREDRDLLDFINAGLRIISVDGTLAEIDHKWGGLGYYSKLDLINGSGLTPSATSTSH